MILLCDPSGDYYPISSYEDFSITHKLDGCDVMSFCVPTNLEQYPLLYEEARVITDDNEWLIKKIDDDKIDCELNFDFVKTTIYKDFNSGSLTLAQMLEAHLPQGWTIEGASVSSIQRTIKFDYCTDFDVIYQCMSVYKVYLVWKIKEQRLIVYSQSVAQSTGEYLTTELNLRSLSFKGDSTDFATRLYAYGKDGVSIADAEIEGRRYGLPYVEDKTYADKTVSAIWTDERYTKPNSLYEDALDILSKLSFPVRAYECNVIDLAKISSDYSFLDFKMHKMLTLIDIERGIRVEHRIVEYKEFPDEPNRNVITLSCAPRTITGHISDTISSVKIDYENIKTDMTSRIAMATAMMTGVFGGYVRTNDSEIFVMDNENPDAAQVVWRWNINGFAKSSTGIGGPYTTALTFDDTFITNIIQAMVIRGSYIEAESINAGSISRSYTDDVLSSAFEATKEYTQSKFNQINNYLTNEEGTGALNVIENRMTTIREDIDGLTASVSRAYTGGINYIKNSSGLNGVSNDWAKSGTVETVQNSDTKNSTVANSCFVLKNSSSIQQTIDSIIADKTYILSVKVKKTGDSLGKVSATYNGTSQVYAYNTYTADGWKEYTATIENVQSDTMTIKVELSGGTMYVADIMLAEGTSPKSWTPAPNEIYTTDVKIDERGISVYRSESDEMTLMNNTEFAGYYQDEEVFSLNKNETRTKKTTVDGELTVGSCKFIPFSRGSESGLNISLID